MHRRPILPLGVKFDPTDVQLILGYLGPKVRGERLAWDVINFSDLVYKKPPWELCTDLTTFSGHEKHYFFTELKKIKQNHVIHTVGSYGTWHESNSKNIFWEDNSIMGFKKLLNFKGKGEGKEKKTDWLMHEFSLSDKKTNLVLCVIQEKKKKKEEMCSAYDKYQEFDPMFCLVRDSTTSADGDPSPAPAPALDSEEEETRPSKKMRFDPKFDDDPSSGGDPCPATAHGDHFKLQALDSEVQETQPSKKMLSDPKSDDNPFPDASCSFEISSEIWEGASQGFSDKKFYLADDVFFDLQIPPFIGGSQAGVKALQIRYS